MGFLLSGAFLLLVSGYLTCYNIKMKHTLNNQKRLKSMNCNRDEERASIGASIGIKVVGFLNHVFKKLSQWPTLKKLLRLHALSGKKKQSSNFLFHGPKWLSKFSSCIYYVDLQAICWEDKDWRHFHQTVADFCSCATADSEGFGSCLLTLFTIERTYENATLDLSPQYL